MEKKSPSCAQEKGNPHLYPDANAPNVPTCPNGDRKSILSCWVQKKKIGPPGGKPNYLGNAAYLPAVDSPSPMERIGLTVLLDPMCLDLTVGASPVVTGCARARRVEARRILLGVPRAVAALALQSDSYLLADDKIWKGDGEQTRTQYQT